MFSLCLAAARVSARQGVTPPSKVPAEDTVAFKAFSDRVQAYVKLQKTVESNLPPLKVTDLPEMIAAHQQALARKLQEARPRAKRGEIFTDAACEAFRRASRAAFQGAHGMEARAYMEKDAADPKMPLAVNHVYPDTAPITAIPPGLLAAFPALPAEVAYRVVGRTLLLVDVKSSLIIDLAREILPEHLPGS